MAVIDNINGILQKKITVLLGYLDAKIQKQIVSLETDIKNQSDKSKIRTYASWDDLGLDVTSATIQNIVEKMSDGSFAILSTSAASNAALCPGDSAANGTIIVHKQGNTRTQLIFETPPGVGKMYHGSYYKTSSGSPQWSGWKKVISAADIVVTGTTVNIITK